MRANGLHMQPEVAADVARLEPAASVAPGHTLRLHVFASGSRGNATVVEDATTGAGVLVDCGICKRDFFTRCDEAGFDPAHLLSLIHI